MPKLTVIAGANGSGKTTFAVPYTRHLAVQFINADNLTKEFEDLGLEYALVKAGREFFNSLNGALNRREDVAIETTLSGRYTTRVVKRAKSLGYKVEVIYIFLDNAELCVKRVKIRHLKGGHDVPVDAIKRRFYRSIANFRNDFQHLADEWTLYYNGQFNHSLVVERSPDQLEIVDVKLYNYFNNIVTDDKE